MKVSGIILFLLFFMMGGLSQAASVGLPVDTEGGEKHIVFSVENSFIFDKDYESGNDTTEIDGSNAVLLKAVYAFNDNYGIYGKVGTADLEVDLDVVGTTATDVAEYDINYDYGIAWGLGFYTSYFWPYSGTKTTLDLQYYSWQSEFDSLTVSGNSPTITTSSDVEVEEWSLSLIFSKELEFEAANENKLTPYIGVRYSDGEIDYGTVTHSNVTIGSTIFSGFSGGMDSEDNFGVIVGLNGQFGKSWELSVEGRFVDETAVSASFSFKF